MKITELRELLNKAEANGLTDIALYKEDVYYGSEIDFDIKPESVLDFKQALISQYENTENRFTRSKYKSVKEYLNNFGIFDNIENSVLILF